MAKKATAVVAALGVDDLAKEMKLTPQTTRMKLRDAGIKRTGRAYSWKNVTELKATAKKLTAAPAKTKKAA